MCDPLALCSRRYRVVSGTLVGSSRGTIRPPLLLAHASERLADVRLVTGGIAEQRVENRSHAAFDQGNFAAAAMAQAAMRIFAHAAGRGCRRDSRPRVGDVLQTRAYSNWAGPQGTSPLLTAYAISCAVLSRWSLRRMRER